MAGKQVYIGRMLETLNVKVEKMTASMEENIKILRNVAMNTAQQLSSVKVKPSEEIRTTGFKTSKSVTVYKRPGTYDSVVLEKLGAFSCQADGTVNVYYSDVNIDKPDYSSYTVSLYFKGDGAAIAGEGVGGTHAPDTGTVSGVVSVPVKKGVPLEVFAGIHLSGSPASTISGIVNIPGNGLNICYSLIDIGAETAFVEV